MRNSVVWTCLLVLGICAYVERDRIFPPKEPEAVYVQPTPKPVHRPEPRLAPEGTFYMVDYASTKTDRGIVGFEKGREVHFFSANRDRGTLVVTDGQYKIEVNPTQITNDLDMAELARLQDENSQTELAGAIKRDWERAHQTQQQIDVERAKHVANIDTGAVIGKSKLDGKPERVGTWEPQIRSSYGYGYYGSPYYYLNR